MYRNLQVYILYLLYFYPSSFLNGKGVVYHIQSSDNSVVFTLPLVRNTGLKKNTCTPEIDTTTHESILLRRFIWVDSRHLNVYGEFGGQCAEQ